jgi:hypothetical protein
MVFSACIYLRSRFFFLERENVSALVESKIDPSDTQHARGVGGLARHFEEHVTSIYRKVSKQTELQQSSLTRNK